MPDSAADPRYRFLARFGSVILSGGIAAIPRALYYYQAELGLLPQEVWFVGYILAHRWTAELPYPSLRKMARRTGVTYQMLHRYKNSLIAKKYLQVLPRSRQNGGRSTNSYDFSSLFQAIEELLLRDRGVMAESLDDAGPDAEDDDFAPGQPELIDPGHRKLTRPGKARLTGAGQPEQTTGRDVSTKHPRLPKKPAAITTTTRPTPPANPELASTWDLYCLANGSPPTPYQARQLSQLAADIDRSRGAGQGIRWLEDAIREAAEAGSAYLSPRRIQRICERWLSAGRPDHVVAQSGDRERTTAPSREEDWRPIEPAAWQATREHLAGTLSAANFRAFVEVARPIGWAGDRVRLAVPDDLTAQRLAGPFRSLVETALSTALGRRMRLDCQVDPPATRPRRGAAGGPDA